MLKLKVAADRTLWHYESIQNDRLTFFLIAVLLSSSVFTDFLCQCDA